MLKLENYLIRTNTNCQVIDISRNQAKKINLELIIKQIQYDITNIDRFKYDLPIYSIIDDLHDQKISVTLTDVIPEQPSFLCEKDIEILQKCNINDLVSFKLYLDVSIYGTESYRTRTTVNLSDVLVQDIKKIKPLINLTSTKKKPSFDNDDSYDFYGYEYQLIAELNPFSYVNESTLSKNAKTVLDTISTLNCREKDGIFREMVLQETNLTEKNLDEAIYELEKEGIVKRLLSY